YYFRKYMDYNTRYQALVQSQSELAGNNQVLQAKMAEYENALNLMKDPRMLVVKMPSIPKGPDSASMTTVYWDSLSKDVYLSVSHLPDPSETQQYQLWALLDGKPIDAGVIELRKGVAMVKMKNIPKADAFAITLEKKGGSPSPNLKQLYVMGKV
ncbi:MAG TPA: anti-sigma factor, partial [Flavitalea sp.]|nr:anti-sigma factor [Flavitalea sp.]